MDEVIELENKIRAALANPKLKASGQIILDAKAIMAGKLPLVGTRLERLRVIAAKLTGEGDD